METRAIFDNNNSHGFRLVHLGIAVAALDKAISEHEKLFGYKLVSGPFTDPIQRVSVCFLSQTDKTGMTIELVEPAGDDSPVNRVLAKNGGGPYHLGYEVGAMAPAIEHARKAGCLVISQPAPAVAFGGRPIAWLYTPTRHLVEFIQGA